MKRAGSLPIARLPELMRKPVGGEGRDNNKTLYVHDCLMTLFVWNRTSNRRKSRIKQQRKTKQMPFSLIEVSRSPTTMGGREFRVSE
jgi:hypothetical protein